MTIPSFAILDHWFNYGIRFSAYKLVEQELYEQDKQHPFLPNRILVMDDEVRAAMIQEGFVTSADIASELPLLPKEERYWLREILLCADGEPWLAGRTVVPESTLSGPELALQRLGNTPLGRYLFTSSELTRDFIEIGRDAELWGRRSRLRLSGKPLILTELFLPASPLY